MPELEVFFTNGTTFKTMAPGIKADPALRCLMINDEHGDSYVFVLDNVRYWKYTNPKVRSAN